MLKQVKIEGQCVVGEKPFPKAYSPSEKMNFIQLNSYFTQNAQAIMKEVNQEGAIFFRGFDVKSATQFSSVLTQLGIKSFEYVGGAAVRNLIVGS